MTEILKEERLLKEVRDYFEPKGIPIISKWSQEDIELLKYEETIIIKSIRSKSLGATRDRAHRRQHRISKSA